MTKVLLYGASGHAKVVLDCMKSLNLRLLAIFDDDPNPKELSGTKIIGSYRSDYESDAKILISIGDNLARKNCSKLVVHKFINIIHRSAIISPGVIMGVGNAIFHGSILQSGVSLGDHAIVNTGAVVDHDCILGDFSHVSPNATLCGNVKVGEGVHIGAGATIIPGVEIGDWSVIGAGSVITKDVPPGAIVVGDKHRILRFKDGK